MWQAEADTELTLSASPATGVGQTLLTVWRNSDRTRYLIQSPTSTQQQSLTMLFVLLLEDDGVGGGGGGVLTVSASLETLWPSRR